MKAIFALAALAALLLSACGGGGSTSAESANPPNEESAQAELPSEPELDDEDAIRETIKNYYLALADGDPQSACDLRTPSGQKDLVGFASYYGATSPQASCVRAINDFYLAEDRRNPRIHIASANQADKRTIRIKGDKAVATLKSGPPIHLRRVEGDWLISAGGTDYLPKKGELSTRKELTVQRATLAIRRYCLDALKYKAGQLAQPPSGARTDEKDEAVQILVSMFKENPKATLLTTGGALRDQLTEAAQVARTQACDLQTAAVLLDAVNGR